MSDFREVSRFANQQALSLVSAWLPAGRLDGINWCVGSRDGEPGQSLKIAVKGEKVGIWQDFETDDKGADLIDLYQYLNGCQKVDALKAVASQVGYALSKPDVSRRASSKVDAAPPKPSRSSVWEPVLPVPSDAPKRPHVHSFKGPASAGWKYIDQQGRTLGFVMRFDKPDGSKEVLPLTFCRNNETGECFWRWLSFPAPRPLFFMEPLRDGFPVVVVEGEKCVQALFKVVRDRFDVVTWPGGSKAVSKADFSLLKGREVVLWPDCDGKRDKAGNLLPAAKQPGMAAMVKVAGFLRKFGCPSVRMVQVPAPGDVEDGWDCADLIQKDGASPDLVFGYLDGAAQFSGGGSSSGSDSGISFIRSDKGNIRSCPENLYLVLSQDEECRGLLRRELCSGKILKSRVPPWGGEAGEWSPYDSLHLGIWLGRKYDFVVRDADKFPAVEAAAADFAFNEVQDWLNGCASVWDGTPRVAGALHRYWGTPDNAYYRLISTMFFVGIAARGLDPGCKHDCAPVFEGRQGLGKSRMLRIIGGRWFSDVAFTPGAKDGYMLIRGRLIHEFSELEQFRRAEVTAIKNFMSMQMDSYREPYSRNVIDVPRMTVFAATTNEVVYFKDTTGNRRFWPVIVGDLDPSALEADRDQLLGEAVYMYRNGVKWHPTPKQQRELIDPIAEEKEVPDIWMMRIQSYLEGVDVDGIPSLSGRKVEVSMSELFSRALGLGMDRAGPAKQETTRIGQIMMKLGWPVKRTYRNGVRDRWYFRPEPASVGGGAGGGDVPF